MNNKTKFLALVSEGETDTAEKNKQRINNRYWLQHSRQMAFKILVKLEQLGWSKEVLANKMNASLVDINQLIQGKQDLPLSTLLKLEQVLHIPILVHDESPVKEAPYQSATVSNDS